MTLRPATLDDSRLLYDWRTDPVTVAMFDQPPPASYEDHLAWLTTRLTTPGLYIGEVDGQPVGTIRLDPDHTLSVTVAPEARGKGYGSAMIRACCRLAHNGRVEAHIKWGNVWSQRAFEAAGFVIAQQTSTHTIYSRLGGVYARTANRRHG